MESEGPRGQQQTVPRSEVRVVLDVIPRAEQVPTTVLCDCLGVVNGIQELLQGNRRRRKAHANRAEIHPALHDVVVPSQPESLRVEGREERAREVVPRQQFQQPRRLLQRRCCRRGPALVLAHRAGTGTSAMRRRWMR